MRVRIAWETKAIRIAAVPVSMYLHVEEERAHNDEPYVGGRTESREGFRVTPRGEESEEDHQRGHLAGLHTDVERNDLSEKVKTITNGDLLKPGR